MGRTLYELTGDLIATLEVLEDPTIEVDADFVAKALALEKDADRKITNIGRLVKQLMASHDAYANEIDRMSKRKKSLAKRVDYLLDLARDSLAATGKDSVVGLPVVKLRKLQPMVTSVDMEKLDEQFTRTPPTPAPEPDKKGIMDHFRETGEIPEGVDIATDRVKAVVE